MSDSLPKAVTPQPAPPERSPGRQEPAHDAAPGRKDDELPNARVAANQSAEERWREKDEKLDRALEGTFPASDPFSIR